ncbi:MAG: alpha/beta hydrolase [Bacteroidota bacterium]
MRLLPQLVKDMKNGDFSGIGTWALYGRMNRIGAMSAAMDMASGISPERKKRVLAQSKNTLLEGAINFPYWSEQASLGVPDLGDAFRRPVQSELPVLCISGTLDGRTPVSNAEEVLETLPNGQHIIIEGAGHSDPLFLSSPKILENMLLFLKGKSLKDKYIKLAPIEFVIKPEE